MTFPYQKEKLELEAFSLFEKLLVVKWLAVFLLPALLKSEFFNFLSSSSYSPSLKRPQRKSLSP